MQAEAVPAVGGGIEAQGTIAVQDGKTLPSGGAAGVIITRNFLELFDTLVVRRDLVNPQDGIGARPDPVGEALDPEGLVFSGIEAILIEIRLCVEESVSFAWNGNGLLLAFLTPDDGVDGETDANGIGLLAVRLQAPGHSWHEGGMNRPCGQFGSPLPGERDVDLDALQFLRSQAHSFARAASGEITAVDLEFPRGAGGAGGRVNEVDVGSVACTHPVGILCSAGKREVVNAEEIGVVRGGGEIEKRITADRVAVALVFVTAAVRDGNRTVHAGVDDLGAATDDDPLSLLEVQFIVVDRRGIRVPVHHGIEGKFLRRFGRIVGLVDLLGHGAHREGAWGGQTEARSDGDFVKTGRDFGSNRHPVAQRLVTFRLKLGGFHRDLSATDTGMGEEQPGGFSQVGSADGDFHRLSDLGPLRENGLQVGLRKLSGRKGRLENRARGEEDPRSVP